MNNNEELTLEERIHLANKDLKNILKPSITVAIMGLVIIALVGISTFVASNTINEYSYTVYRTNSATGPLCDPINFVPVSDSDPAKVNVLEGQGADRAGVLTGDVITGINGIQITNAGMFNKWQNMLPNVKPGDNVNVVALRGNQQIDFTVKATSSQNAPNLASLGMVIPSKCGSYFELKDEKKLLESEFISAVSNHLDNILILSGIFTTIFCFFLVLTLWKGRKLSVEIKEWENAYLDQHYVLTFETNNPMGSTNGEKIFNMAQTVFPELRHKYGKAEPWNGSITGKTGYTFDCFQQTNEFKPRLFVAKHFDQDVTVDLEKLQELFQMIRESKALLSVKEKIKNSDRMKIFRVICVASKYDQKLLDDSSREEILEKLFSDCPLDLVIEKDNNYSVLSVSRIEIV